jgi:aldehyde:ferredoxin oxidoreductase
MNYPSKPDHAFGSRVCEGRMFGWRGNILRIDLSSRTFAFASPGAAVYEKWIGGKGLSGYYLQPFITRSFDDPDMPLLFFTGPLVDTPTPTSGRITIASRSPLSGTVGDTSVGGFFGTHLKRAGIDGIIVTGKSDTPIGIIVHDDAISFHDASHLSGKSISQRLSAIPGEGSVALIGPAAENGVLFASIMIDGHYASGRGGLGLVMASKNLYYLRIRGSSKTPIHNDETIRLTREEIMRLTSASPALFGEFGLSNFGTGALFDLINARRMTPTDNFTKTFFPKVRTMNAYQYRQRYQTKKSGCAGCQILCKKKGTDGTIIPEYETMSHFSALIGNFDIDAVVEANRACNEMGMDTISAAVTLATYAEISGEKLTPERIIGLLWDIAHSRHEGKLLKLGSYRYAEKMRRIDASMTVKKLELPAYDPRGSYGMALAYATSTRGGCHLRAYPISYEILRKPIATDRFSFSGKSRIIKISEDVNAIIDSLTACKFIFFAATLEEFALAFRGATSTEATAQELLRAGERIYYHDRVMNALNGFSSADDDLPARFFTMPGSSGDGIAIPPIDRNAFCAARAAYYQNRRLDERGLPTDAKMRELGIA